MSFITTLSGQLFTLQNLIENQVLTLRLFSNDLNPSKTTASNLYEELVHANYSDKLLTPSEWVYAIDGLTGNYFASFAQQVWTFTTSVTVYGYMITDNAGSNVFFSERFPNAPIILTVSGDRILVTPVIGAK